MGLVGDHTGSGARLRQLSHFGQHGSREGRRFLGVAVRVLERDLAADDGVRVLVRLVDDRRERARDRVGQDVGTADHRDAEDDRERSQDGAELSSEQSLDGYADHRESSSMTAMTSLASDGPTSLTIFPSARNRILSAIAAARASCVTITVVWP